MKKLRELEIRRSTKDILYEALSNLFLLMFLKDNERNRGRLYYVALVSIYFAQIAGFLCTISQVSITDQYLGYLFEMCNSFRLTYLLHSLNSSIVIAITLTVLCIYEIFLLFITINLSFANIKGALQLYFEHQKWIYCLPKLDFIFGLLFCDGQSSSRCSAAINNLNSGVIYYFIIACSIILLLTTLCLNIVIVLIYHNPELNSVNQLKSRYSQFKQMEPLLEIGLVMSTYVTNPAFVFVLGQIFGIFLLIEYFYHFPLMDKNISDIYGWMILVYQIFVSMLFFREYTTSIKDVNFPITFLLIISIFYGILKSFWNNKIIFAMTVDPNRLGGEEKPTISGGMIIDLGQDIKIKGVDFARICTDLVVFEKWFMLFVDYQFEVLISHLIKKGQEIIVQEVCLRYWFFLIKFKKNQIKALYQNKIMNTLLKRKDSFFQTVERSLTNLIESKIKEKDKAHFYSYSQKDRQDAINNLKFDKMVQSETQKDRMKKILGNLITEKCDYMERMIKGYRTLEELRLQTVSFLQLVEYFENTLSKQISQNNQNIYFLKFSSLMKAYVLFDPLSCRDTESAVEDIINKEKSIDQTTTITSISILQGNVGSIIASFKNVKENGKILKFSEKIPQIFKYNKGEFQTKESVTDLIPDCIGRIHDQFLMRLITTGIAKTVRNYRTMFAKDKIGYIFRVKLFINFYFVKQDDFAFSALIINCPSNDMYVILNSTGYIEGMSQNFVELIEGESVDLSYYKKLNISALIPQFVEFMQEFNSREEYSFLKFKLDVPKDMNKYIQTFMLHHSNYYGSSDKQSKTLSHSVEWKNNVSNFLNTRVNQKSCSYELTLNVKHELFSDNGEDVLLYILEIQQHVNWDELYASEFSNSTGGRSKQSQKKDKDEKGQQIQQTQTMRNDSVFFENKNTSDRQLMLNNLGSKDASLGKEESLVQEGNTGLLVKQDDKEGDLMLSKSGQVDTCDDIDKKQPHQKNSNLSKHTNYMNLDESNMPLVEDRKFDENILETNQLNHTLMMTTQNNEDDKEQLNKGLDKTKTMMQQTTRLDDTTQNFQSTQAQDQQETAAEVSQQQTVEQKQKEKDENSSIAHESKNAGKESISVFDDVKKEGINDLVRQMGRNNELPHDQGSKSSVQSSQTSIIKHIVDNTSSKDTPPFMMISYCVFIFQFFVFITVVIVLSVTISDSFNSYTKEQITFFIEQKYLLVNNLNATYSLLLQSMLKIDDDLGTLQNSIILVNTYSIVLAIVLIIFSFGFIVPSYNNLKFKSERILMIVSRLKQEETSEIIFHLKGMAVQLFSDDDEYLHVDFSNFALREENELDQSQRNGKKKSKQRQNYLYDRIIDTKLRFWTFIVILVTLCLLSLLFFLIVFIYLNQFKSVFGVPASNYKNFIEGSMQFTTAVCSHNQILMNSFLQEQKLVYLSPEKLQELIGLREQTLLAGQTYFTQQFVTLQQSNSNSFDSQIINISQGNLCTQGILETDFLAYCSSALQGILTQGFQPTVSTMIQKVQNEMNISTGFESFINTQEYQDGLIIQQLLTNIMTFIVEQFENENVTIKNNYLSSLLMILAFGCLIYVVIFFVVIVIYLTKLKSEYLVIKRAIQLVPYRRLTEDSMTLFLLKKVMDVNN